MPSNWKERRRRRRDGGKKGEREGGGGSCRWLSLLHQCCLLLLENGGGPRHPDWNIVQNHPHSELARLALLVSDHVCGCNRKTTSCCSALMS